MNRSIGFFVILLGTAVLSTALLRTPPQASSQPPSRQFVLIKADDLWDRTSNWDRFFALSKRKGVKVSAGIICNALPAYPKDHLDWLRELRASGWVEFWNHGWDHKRWRTDQGVTLSEFFGSGYEHQKEHFDQSQTLLKEVFGEKPTAFGAPYNKIDADTVRVLNEDPDLHLFFGYGAIAGLDDKVLARMNLPVEHDGVGKPNFKKFKAAYKKKKDRPFTVIQFHPNSFSEKHFTEYGKILDFLIAEGWTFVQPTEYLAKVAQADKS